MLVLHSLLFVVHFVCVMLLILHAVFLIVFFIMQHFHVLFYTIKSLLLHANLPLLHTFMHLYAGYIIIDAHTYY